MKWNNFKCHIVSDFLMPSLLLLLSRFSPVQLCDPVDSSPLGFLCPWDSPGKNTGVGCHFLLQCMKVKSESESEVVQSCPTLREPMDCSLPGSSVHGLSRQEYWSGVPSPSPNALFGLDKIKRRCKALREMSFHFPFFSLSSVRSLSRVQLFVTPWTTARQASLSITNSWSLLKLMSIESVMPSNHLILCRTLLLPPSIFPSIRVFSKSQFFESGAQSIGASATASVLPMNIQD